MPSATTAVSSSITDTRRRSGDSPVDVALLTGGGDRPYAFGLSSALTEQGLFVDFIGSDHLDAPQVRNNPRIRFLNLRNQAERASLWTKMTRVLVYYARLVAYAARSRAPVFHLLWNNKFEHFDRTVLMLYYRLLGKRLVFTAHNVNAGERDGKNSWLNRYTLKIQYRLCDHIFVHTQRMKRELTTGFDVPDQRATVIPFGINNTLPTTALGQELARRELELQPDDQVLLFFGNIAPYKGLDVLVRAFAQLVSRYPRLRLVIAGRPKGSEEHWATIQREIVSNRLQSAIRQHIEYIPDEKVEVFFKAADILVLPYNHVFQSGVLFLGYSFGLPVIATDVGSLREEIIEGETGWICKPKDPSDIARTIETWLTSPVYEQRELKRSAIQSFANHQYSWTTVGMITAKVYGKL